jgi:hypothetical protein
MILLDTERIREGTRGRSESLTPFLPLLIDACRGPLFRFQLQEAFTLAVAPSLVSPHRSVDASGRALPMTDAEIRARADEIARGLDALDDMGDAEEQRQTLEALIKAIDQEPLSGRKRFR